MTRAWEIVPERSGDRCFGLHAAETAPLGVYGPLDLATMSSATVGEALERTVRYYATMGAMSELSIAREKTGALRLVVKPVVKARTDLRQYVEHLFALVVTRIRMAALAHARDAPRRPPGAATTVGPGGATSLDIIVRFTHAAPPRATEHARVLGPRVRFGQRVNELVVGAKTASLPLVTANPELSPLLEREGKRLALRPDATTAERVRAAIEQGLRDGRVELADVAKRLGVGARTLQRSLARDRESFADILDAIRRDVALKTLADGGAASDLAYTLGFSQPSAFFRAFKRWTGTTPAEWTIRAGRAR